MKKDTIQHNVDIIRKRIDKACKKARRNPKEIKLLLATKTVSPERIIEAFNYGETLIGENKVQEVKEKYQSLKNFKHEKHFIGHLQSNKIKDVIKYNINCIQSLDRLSLAEKLNQKMIAADKVMDVFIQVNTSNEESKFGIKPEEVITLVREVSKLENLRIKGLMTIGLFSSDMHKVRQCFKLLKSIQKQIVDLEIENVEMNELSMGMSGDLEIAIEEGATIIRVGTAIFGERQYPDSYYWNEGISIT